MYYIYIIIKRYCNVLYIYNYKEVLQWIIYI